MEIFLNYAMLCHLVYENNINVDNVLKFFNFNDIETIYDRNKCLVFSNDQTLYLVIRGSANLYDWIQDLKFSSSNLTINDISIGDIHSGFKECYLNVIDEIKAIVKSEMKENIIFLGHSLGGAIAELCALDLRLQYSDINFQLITFGCPKVGNIVYTNYYNRTNIQVYRFVNINQTNQAQDIVTKLGYLGGKHVGEWVYKVMFNEEYQDYSEMYRLYQSFVRLNHTIMMESVIDSLWLHYIVTYQEGICQNNIIKEKYNEMSNWAYYYELFINLFKKLIFF